MDPLFSIIIANYDYGRFLGEAIRSVLAQIGEGASQVRPGEVELIIIDGGSSDNSVDVIKKYAGSLPPGQLSSKLYPLSSITYWISEPDKGQSDAFNKGFAKARGRFLTWLNADDVMLPGALAAVKREIERHPEGRWFAGGSVWGDADLKLQRCFRAHRFSRLRAAAGSLMVGGPSSFFEKSLLEEVGGVDESLHYAMDIDLWYRFYRQAGQTYHRTKSYVWGYRIHPDSKMSGPTLDPESEASRRRREELFGEFKRLAAAHGFHRDALWRRWAVCLSTSLVDRLAAKRDERRCRGRDMREVVR